MNRRGLSPVLGLVLLLGITAIASTAIFLAGMSLAEATQSEATHEQAESSMAELAQSGDRIATSETREAEFSIRGADSARVRSLPDAGRINVTVTNRSSGNRIFALEEDLGAFVYEADDGTEIAYQAGGVWRRDPSGGSTVVRSPQFHYRENPEPTITFPVSLVRGTYSASGDSNGRLVAQQTTNHYPDAPNHFNPLTDGSVKITIESRYCQGWESYFEEYTDGSAAESCEDGVEGQLVIEFSVPFVLNGVDGGVMVDGGADNFPHEDYPGIDEDDVHDSTEAQSATSLVESQIEECEESGEDLNGRTHIDDPGLYCADDGEMTGSRHYTFNTSDGDIRVAVDGDLYDDTDGSNSGIDVEGDGNLTLFVRGDVLEDGASQSMTIGNSSDPSQTRIFVHSDADTIGDNSNPNIYALIYAPNTDVSLQSSSTTFEGAIVADNIDAHHNMNFRIDPATANLSFNYQIGDAPFYYLHISETEMTVED